MGSNAILPQIIVEAALTPGNPVSGSGTMTLNSATFGLLDTDFLGTADSWTDISAFVRNFTITRTSTRVQGPLYQFQQGTVSIELDNSDGRFDPDNLSGPYVSGGVTQVHAMVPVRIRAVFNDTFYLFRGFADSWQESPVAFAGPESIWTLSASDGFKILNGVNLATISAAGSGELTGARMNRILDAAGWYTGQGGGARKIDSGSASLQATTFGDTALNLAQLAADSEIGEIYIDGSGAFVFRQRSALLSDARSTISQVTFSDTGTGGGTYPTGYFGIYTGGQLPCAAIARADDDTTIANDVQATRVGGTQQEVMDAASIALYLFPRTYQRSDLILVGDSDALNWANWVLYISKTGEDRFDSVAVDPYALPSDLWPQVLAREIGDRITVTRNPPGVSTVTRDGFIVGITHQYDAVNSTWLTSYDLQDASKYSAFMTLNSSTSGLLNVDALAF